MNKVHSTNDLLIAAKPPQFQILDQLIAAFRESPYLRRAYVRGSMAAQNFDRVSDVDFAAVYPDDVFEQMLEVVDEVMQCNFSVILPAWRDSIVKDFGGVGYVYLVEKNGVIYSVDLYLLPASKVDGFVGATKGKLVYLAEDSSTPVMLSHGLESSQGCAGRSDGGNQVVDLAVEMFTVSFLILKRIKRSQIFLNYAETGLLNVAYLRLVRATYDADFVDYGWYHIEERLGRHAAGQNALRQLEAFIRVSVSSREDVSQRLRAAIELLRVEHAEVHARLEKGMIFFLEHFGL